MSQWPDSRITELFAIELPLLQAPMAGASGSQMAIAVAQAGGLGALPCAMLTPEKIEQEVATFRQQTGNAPLNLNFSAINLLPTMPSAPNAGSSRSSPITRNWVPISMRRHRSLTARPSTATAAH